MRAESPPRSRISPYLQVSGGASWAVTSSKSSEACAISPIDTAAGRPTSSSAPYPSQSPSAESKTSTRSSVVMCKQSFGHTLTHILHAVQVSQMTPILPLY
ncbi:MAG: hypothetical protein CMA84_02060 [Euryarchaeota archaeon]|nr:hypothetical protein [Euryarchaeota archaeon]